MLEAQGSPINLSSWKPAGPVVPLKHTPVSDLEMCKWAVGILVGHGRHGFAENVFSAAAS